MKWFNVYGFIFICVIMVPNIVFAIKCKDGFNNKWNNKIVEVLEQIGRFSCFTFMIINMPKTCLGWISYNSFIIYIIVNSVLVFFYCLIWTICFKKSSLFRALSLSIIPSIIFAFSGIMIRSILLIISSIIFAPCHIMISYYNFKYNKN